MAKILFNIHPVPWALTDLSPVVAMTISSPTAQLTARSRVMVLAPAAAVLPRYVHVMSRDRPCRSSVPLRTASTWRRAGELTSHLAAGEETTTTLAAGKRTTAIR